MYEPEWLQWWKQLEIEIQNMLKSYCYPDHSYTSMIMINYMHDNYTIIMSQIYEHD